MRSSPNTSGKGRDDKIPPQALATLLIAIVVDLNFLGAPRIIVGTAGQDHWISVLISLVATALAVWVMFRLIERHPDMTLVEISEAMLGRIGSVALVGTYVLFWLGTAAFLMQLQSHLFTRALLPNTPPFFLSVYMIVLAVYLARHGIEPMARLFLLFLPILVLVFGCIIALSIGRGDPERLLPILEHGWEPVLKAAWITYGANHGIEFLLMVGPFLSTFRGGLKASLFGVGVVHVLGLVLGVLLVVRFGAGDVANHSWPTLSLVGVVELPGFTGLRLDPLFLTLWTLFIFVSIAAHLYLSGSATQRLLRLTDIQWPVLGAGAVLLALSAVDINPLDLLAGFEQVVRWVSPVHTLIIPLLLFVLGSVRKKTA